ncbi:hypothetical protein FNU76_19240 [Chitinimonas arctica]|uniref:Uncharacterized protein n=1 Tax=Chitinimonas arctica TaxID=2594795 RepID=A0A516SJK0_9NEIS|nr:hypothetical protein [Chitinimonas arctica]QDQ28313.1 hypothetical protein FNU76_19240 [Chitinimonas arctica]
MQIFDAHDATDDVISALQQHGIVAVAGSRVTAMSLIETITRISERFDHMMIIPGYQTVPRHGYLYFLRDANRYPAGDPRIKFLLLNIDAGETRFLAERRAA